MDKIEKYVIVDWMTSDEGGWSDPIASFYMTRRAARAAKKRLKRFIDEVKLFKLVEVR